MRMYKWTLFFVVIAVFIFAPAFDAEAQEPFGEPVEPFTPPELVWGEPYVPPARDFAASIVGEPVLCDYLPRWVDNRGEGDVLPPGFPESGDVQEILDWTGLEVSRLHGCERAQGGEIYLSLEALELKCGAAVVQVRVDQDSVPLDGALIWFNWPNMGDANQMTPEVDPRYFEEGIGGFTDAGGSVGFGYGGGSFIVPGRGGPFSAWGNSCLDPGCRYGVWVGSDVLFRTGWFGGTNHCTINPWFSPRVKMGDVPPQGEDDFIGVFSNGQMLYHIPIKPGAPTNPTFSGLRFEGEEGTIWHVEGVEE